MEARLLNKAQTLIILHTKNFHRRVHIHRHVEFSKNCCLENNGDYFILTEISWTRNFVKFGLPGGGDSSRGEGNWPKSVKGCAHEKDLFTRLQNCAFK